jgi:shikimate 5-dehydrogenase
MSPETATRLFGVIGKPVAGNPTQEMIEEAFAAAGVDARYVSLEVEPSALGDAVRGIRALGFGGIHVTVPHKVAVVPLLDRVTEAAQLAGAVNCVKHGHRILAGLGMLVEQAVIGFRRWMGIEPDRSAMRAALERELGRG